MAKVRLILLIAGLLVHSASLARVSDEERCECARDAESLAPEYGAWGFDRSGQDLSVRPGDNFYSYANGAWVRENPIPGDMTTYSLIALVRERVAGQLKDIVEQAARKPAPNRHQHLVGSFYQAYVEEAEVEAAGLKPLSDALDTLRAIETRQQLARFAGERMGSLPFLFQTLVEGDTVDPDKWSPFVGQAGLGMPSRDYYLLADFTRHRAAYEDYIVSTLRGIGWAAPEASASAILDFETRLASAHWSQADSRDDSRTYHPVAAASLPAVAPGFPWEIWLQAGGLGDTAEIVLKEDSAISEMARIFEETPVETLRAWTAFHLLDASSPYLSAEFAGRHFLFHGTVLEGQEEQRPRWQRAIEAIDLLLTEALGRLYADAYFAPHVQEAATELVENVVDAFSHRIENLDWMSPATRQRALEKLGRMRVNIGAPPSYWSYPGLSLEGGSLIGMVYAIQAHNWHRERSRLGRPVDRSDWPEMPHIVNARYRQSRNEITFPAAVLQPPFFDPAADPAVNYGAIGAIIGHEISHGFDDEGRKFDGSGALRDWWEPRDDALFQERAAKLIDQYENLPPTVAGSIDGRLTLDENIADLGGLVAGLEAYRLSLGGNPAPVLDGVTGEQRVFFGWAQFWRGSYRTEALRRFLNENGHSPFSARVNGVVRNIDEWYEAFHIEEDDDLYLPPEERVRIW